MASKETPRGGGDKRHQIHGKACAACKYQRRRCGRDCPLRPYFPADRPSQFKMVRDVFGVSNITKMIQKLPHEKRDDYIKTIIYESMTRVENPLHGPLQVTWNLMHKITLVEAELIHTRNLIEFYKAKAFSAAANYPAVEDNYYFQGGFAGIKTAALDLTLQQQQPRGGDEDLRIRHVLDPIDSSVAAAATLNRTAAILNPAATAAFDPVDVATLDPAAFDRGDVANLESAVIDAYNLHSNSYDGFPLLYSAGGYFGNLSNRDETSPLKRNQAQQEEEEQQILDDTVNNENAIDNNNERPNSMQKDDANSIS